MPRNARSAKSTAATACWRATRRRRQFRVTKKFVKLPGFQPELAIALAGERGIPIAPTEKSNGPVAVAISSLSNGKTVSGTVQVVGSVNTTQLVSWKVEIGEGASPTDWKPIGTGTKNVDNGLLGALNTADLKNGVYTIRLTAEDKVIHNLQTQVQVNVKKSGGSAIPTGPTPPQTPVPNTR